MSTCPDCDAPSVNPNDFCEEHIPTCEICDGYIPYRIAGKHYANCGSRSCENRYYEN
jgi:hypothetical protein